MKITLELDEKQARLLVYALDMYSRIGIGQFNVICDHPTFQKVVEEKCRPKRELIVGDKTPQGEILEIKEDKALINGSVKDGKWNVEHEWKELKDVVLSTDWEQFHNTMDSAKAYFSTAKQILIGNEYGNNSSYGIHNENVDDSCRAIFDMIQVIRYELYLADENPDKPKYTVNAYPAHRTSNEYSLIKCKIDE